MTSTPDHPEKKKKAKPIWLKVVIAALATVISVIVILMAVVYFDYKSVTRDGTVASDNSISACRESVEGDFLEIIDKRPTLSGAAYEFKPQDSILALVREGADGEVEGFDVVSQLTITFRDNDLDAYKYFGGKSIEVDWVCNTMVNEDDSATVFDTYLSHNGHSFENVAFDYDFPRR